MAGQVSRDENIIYRIGDAYKHTTEKNAGNGKKGFFGIVGNVFEASGGLGAIEKKQAKLSIVKERVKQNPNLSAGQKDQMIAMAEKELVEVQLKYGYLTPEQAAKELEQIKNNYPRAYFGSIVR